MSEKEHRGFKHIENKKKIHRLKDTGNTIERRNRRSKVQTSTNIKSSKLWRTILKKSHQEKTLSFTFQSRCGWSVQERFEQQMKTRKYTREVPLSQPEIPISFKGFSLLGGSSWMKTCGDRIESGHGPKKILDFRSFLTYCLLCGSLQSDSLPHNFLTGDPKV